ncbi:DUF2628 domain-containing protein [Carnobacterium maltaromaticum]|uniref:DUF2628 domain-containing protein n=1 Tax=Carnobacterium TaxID=2747 RepID=UPI00055944E4|nr:MULTISPECIES: DUF2628 domain-containing protein [Carnobacterium]MDT1946526.1 DUF2628 domain-containing protein [Carnobacterium maltaromaticum]MDT2000893.1 DUF2628 domain-containing protein [Carnobacterium maltaromaticum]TFJ25683.1 DUF2628 domain-containing protein [Carnobacterium maltaromaticum]TFJ30695.1 DUF2628 domain-containing protein [Carnobacterium maltaromaticum]TFJ33875.1 DUF2628 domain-containing protein [Carnobacterium maltaromaticum]
MNFCTECGVKNFKEAKFCSACGHKIEPEKENIEEVNSTDEFNNRKDNGNIIEEIKIDSNDTEYVEDESISEEVSKEDTVEVYNLIEDVEIFQDKKYEQKFSNNKSNLNNDFLNNIKNFWKKTNLSFWAIVFSVFYYIYKGLWKKGLYLYSLTLLISLPFGYVFLHSDYKIGILISAIIFGVCGKIDVRRKEELGETMWPEIPDVFNKNWVPIAAIVISLGISIALPGYQTDELEQTAKQILVDKYGIDIQNVTITDKIEKNKYRAIANTTTGEAQSVLIEYIPKTQIVYVSFN